MKAHSLNFPRALGRPYRGGVLVCVGLVLQLMNGLSATERVGPVPPDVRQEWRMDSFYQKYVGVGRLPIVSSQKTSDFALLEAAYIVRQMLGGRPDIVMALATNHVKVVVMAYNEYTTDLPEQSHMKPAVYWDSRARGLGGRTCSCAEENLLCFPGDPYSTENIFIHEFAHVIHGQAMRSITPEFDQQLKEAYEDAVGRGLWKGTYAAIDRGEYWAESVQDWFDNNRHDDALHNHVHTRAMLKEYDAGAAKLCAQVFGEPEWRYRKPMERDPKDRVHLAAYDAAHAPRFRWREFPIPDRPRVQFETAIGNFEVELDSKAAPLTVSNFLNYVQQRLYNDGAFFRTVTEGNQPTNQVKILAVQAEASQARTNEFYAAIPLERTRDTGLLHLDGTISMARDAPDSAQHSFFICIGVQPELDFGGKRNPDRQGFAAFGKVTKGMELIRRIHGSHSENQSLVPPIRIQRAVRLN